MGRGVRNPRKKDTTKRPEIHWVRGRCPLCGDDVVTNMKPSIYREGFIITWECWSSRDPKPTCCYEVCLR